ncbi:MAG: DegT/DnrJ/EryC1/StrS family aminotransferase [Alphaproteobacteria bacterium]|nr:DegT/DnrJ/EryC1/StrS family aminotransferase [Alphaproteobacteria bacterium]
MTVPVFKPLLTEDEKNAAVAAIDNGWLGMGAFVGEFEAAITTFLGRGETLHTVAVSTGHAALHLILMEMGIGAGDEVITASFNNIADFQAVLAVGAAPVFCDILPDSLCIDPESAERMIGPKTKAILIMDYACHLCDYAAFRALSEKTGVPIIHDAAHSFGGFTESRPVGGQFDFTMFSFDPVKNITCIDGGAIIVKDEKRVASLREKRLIGMGQPSEVMYRNARAWTYDVQQLGYRYHLANLHAAIGIAQLKKLDFIRSSRVEACRTYTQRLAGIEGLVLPASDFSEALPFIYYVRVQHGKRAEFIQSLKEQGVDTGIHWQPGHRFSLFVQARRDALPVTERIAEEIVTLPLHSGMDKDEQERVIAAVKGFFKRT